MRRCNPMFATANSMWAKQMRKKSFAQIADEASLRPSTVQLPFRLGQKFVHQDQSRNICHLTFRFSVLKMCGILLLRIQQRHLHQQLLPNSKASLAAGVKISWQLLHSIAVEELCNFYNQRCMETVGSCELHEVG